MAARPSVYVRWYCTMMSAAARTAAGVVAMFLAAMPTTAQAELRAGAAVVDVTPERLPVLEPPPRRERFQVISDEAGTAVVTGSTPEWLAETLDVDNLDSRYELIDRLKRLGVGRALQRRGVKPGDRIQIHLREAAKAGDAVTFDKVCAVGGDAGGLAEALHQNRRLWSLLAQDCADPENTLPKPLRAQIISLSLWVSRHTSAVMRDGSDIEPLIEVNRSVMQGLAPGAHAPLAAVG